MTIPEHMLDDIQFMEHRMETRGRDEQLLRRLAEIEGMTAYLKPYATPEWNPLTNWSDCGPLQDKHHVCTNRPRLDQNRWSAWIGEETAKDDDLKRAICLAIVEAHR